MEDATWIQTLSRIPLVVLYVLAFPLAIALLVLSVAVGAVARILTSSETEEG